MTLSRQPVVAIPALTNYGLPVTAIADHVPMLQDSWLVPLQQCARQQ